MENDQNDEQTHSPPESTLQPIETRMEDTAIILLNTSSIVEVDEDKIRTSTVNAPSRRPISLPRFSPKSNHNGGLAHDDAGGGGGGEEKNSRILPTPSFRLAAAMQEGGGVGPRSSLYMDGTLGGGVVGGRVGSSLNLNALALEITPMPQSRSSTNNLHGLMRRSGSHDGGQQQHAVPSSSSPQAVAAARSTSFHSTPGRSSGGDHGVMMMTGK